MKKYLRILVAILILFGGVNLMQITNPGILSVEALDSNRIIPSRPISIDTSSRPSQPIWVPRVRPSKPIN